MSPWEAGAALGPAELLALFTHFLLLSVLAIGGVMATVPDMHRMIVDERGWLGTAEFTAAVALSQAAPGPNLLVVAVLGWKLAGPAGVAAALAGNLLPSLLIAIQAERWSRRLRQARWLRAFTAGMAPLVLGLMLATGWVLTQPVRDQVPALVLAAAVALVMARTRLAPWWPLLVGAVAGAAGWV